MRVQISIQVALLSGLLLCVQPGSGRGGRPPSHPALSRRPGKVVFSTTNRTRRRAFAATIATPISPGPESSFLRHGNRGSSVLRTIPPAQNALPVTMPTACPPNAGALSTMARARPIIATVATERSAASRAVAREEKMKRLSNIIGLLAIGCLTLGALRAQAPNTLTKEEIAAGWKLCSTVPR